MAHKRKRDSEDDEYIDDGGTNDGDTSVFYREDEFSAQIDDDAGRKVIRSGLIMLM